MIGLEYITGRLGVGGSNPLAPTKKRPCCCRAFCIFAPFFPEENKSRVAMFLVPAYVVGEGRKVKLFAWARGGLGRGVLETAGDGYHQVGTARMGSDPVNSDGRILRISILRRAAFFRQAGRSIQHCWRPSCQCD